MERIEERPVGTVPGVFDAASGNRTDPRPAWWLVAGGIVLVLGLGLVIGRATAGSSSADEGRSDDGTQVRTAEQVLSPGALLGSIDGTNRYRASNDDDDVDRYRYAWPGQIVTAPEPATGDAVAWQWETCEVPPTPDEDEDGGGEEPAPLDCTAVASATDETWGSPPTEQTRLLRVVVTIDLGDDVHVLAASRPVAAMPWPDDITPGDPPPAATPSPPPPTSD